MLFKSRLFSLSLRVLVYWWWEAVAVSARVASARRASMQPWVA